jgi:hypothetical protein
MVTPSGAATGEKPSARSPEPQKNLWGRFGKLVQDARVKAIFYPVIVIMAAILAAAGAFIWNEYGPRDIHLVVQVRDDANNLLKGATVGFEPLSGGYQSQPTDGNGEVSFAVPRTNKGTTVSLALSLEGYRIQGAIPTVVLDRNNQKTIVVLQRVAISNPPIDPPVTTTIRSQTPAKPKRPISAGDTISQEENPANTSPQTGKDSEDLSQAQVAALNFLNLVNQNRLHAAYELLFDRTKTHMTEAAFIALKSPFSLGSVGGVKQRTLVDSQSRFVIPDFPEKITGDTYILTFKTVYAEYPATDVFEILTLHKDSGQWKVADFSSNAQEREH